MSDASETASAKLLSEVGDRLRTGLRHVRLGWVGDVSEDIIHDVMRDVEQAAARMGDAGHAEAAQELPALAYRRAVQEIRTRRAEQPEETGPQGTDVDRALLEGLSRLEAPGRRALTLYLQGHTVAEVGELMGCKRSKANASIHRAIVEVRHHLLTREREG